MIQGTPGLLFGVPDHQQGAAALGLGGAEGGAAANPRRIGTGEAKRWAGNERLPPSAQTFGSAYRDASLDPVSGCHRILGLAMPRSQSGDDGHIRREPSWGQGLPQFHGGVHPGAGLVGVPDVPHGDGATAVYHADDDGGGLVAFEGGVYGQGQAARPPPAEDPPQQWRLKQRVTSSSVWQGVARSPPS